MDNYDDLMDFFMDLGNGHTALGIALVVVVVFICIVALVSIVISIVLAVSYSKYNRKPNSADLTGEETARKILDENGLDYIKVKTVGSLVFGNSYSHHFKKVRLRRRTKNKKSIAALAMGAQKSALAVLDKEGDPDMRKRVVLDPIIILGPFAFIPLILIGVLLDVLIFNSQGWVMIALVFIAVLFYLLSFILSILMLKTEKKAQERSYELLRKSSMVTEEEITEIKKLFRLYNIQYINDMILSALELVYYILRIVISVSGNGSISDAKN